MNYIEIAGRRIGPDYPPLVVAELGINHEGSLPIAFEMVDAAARAGIEIIKHQTHIVEDEMCAAAKKVIPGNDPVTTEYDRTALHAESLVSALLADSSNYVVIYPNNDLGSHLILDAYRRLSGHPRFRLIPSMRFEYFLTLLKEARFVLGNSSAGVREAPAYGVPCINIGSRQQNRVTSSRIHNCKEETVDILAAIACLDDRSARPELVFGKGNSAGLFCHIVEKKSFWETSRQKQFNDQ